MKEFILKHPNYVLLAAITLSVGLTKLGKYIYKGLKDIKGVNINLLKDEKILNVMKKQAEEEQKTTEEVKDA